MSFRATIFLFCSLLLSRKMADAGTVAPSAIATRNIFAVDLFKVLTADRTTENVIFSPASIQSCLALAFIGAEGETADELRQGLILGGADKQMVANTFGDFLKSAFKSTTNGPQLTMANRIYVNEGLELNPKFNKIAADYFDSQAEHIKFSDTANAVKTINNWVEQNTGNKIKDVLPEGSVNADTSAVLVNAIYFKAKWLKQFSKSSTHKADFAVSSSQKVPVDMMYQDDRFNYAELDDLDAKAIELPYENSDMSMLVILPNKEEGLKNLNFATMDFNRIASRLRKESVDVFLPKFKIDFDVDLKPVLNQMGMSKMFSSKADFSGLFTSSTPQRVSEVQHKAYLEVNEAGSEAAAATYMKMVPMSLNLEQKSFRADHPFVFAIRSPQAVYFAGHVAKINGE